MGSVVGVADDVLPKRIQAVAAVAEVEALRCLPWISMRAVRRMFYVVVRTCGAWGYGSVNQTVQVVVAMQQIEAFGVIPRETLGQWEPLFCDEGVDEGYHSGVLVEQLPGIVDDTSVMAGKVTVVGPRNRQIAGETGWFVISSFSVEVNAD